MNKYNKSTVIIDKKEVDRSKVVFIPKEIDGVFKTSDGTIYKRDIKGCIRRIGKDKKENKK